MGDFKALFDQDLDGKTNKKDGNNKGLLPRYFLKFAEEYILASVWRLRNPTGKDYTFFLE